MMSEPAELDHPPRHARVTLGAALILLGVLVVAILKVLAASRDCHDAACANPAVQSALHSF